MKASLILLITPLLFSQFAFALSNLERDRIRFHLENLYNEELLLIRNHKVNLRDVEKQERDFKGLQVYDRIPLTENQQDLQDQLQDSARDAGLKIIEFQSLPRPQGNPKLPERIFSSDRSFHLHGNQVAQEIPFKLRLSGDSKKIQKWVSSWSQEIMRFLEPRGRVQNAKMGSFTIEGVAFRFRDLHFPRIQAQDPIHFLPEWAKKNPQRFAGEEPQLWDYVVKTRETIPKAAPYYSDMEKFQLNDARLAFYIAKTTRH